MAARFEEEPAVRQLAAQFVLIKLDTGGSEDWKKWSRKYDHEGRGIPIVFVVRADGKQLYGKSGTPDPLEAFLLLALNGSGKILNDRQLDKLAKDAEQAQTHVEAGELEQAVALVARSAGSGSFARPAVAIDKLATELEEKGNMAFEEARQPFASDGATLDQAFALLDAEQTYGELPSLKKTFNAALADLRKDAAKRELLQQAELIQKARGHEAEQKWKPAVAAYQLVVTKFPDTPAAELAAGKLKELAEQQGVEVSAADPKAGGPAKPRADPVADDQNEKQAASQLRFGKALMKGNPAKARGYLEKAIELAPDSSIADEARELLKKL